MAVESETLDKYLVEVRRIAESREKGAERKILKIYRELCEDLNGYLGNIYAKYADEDDRLTRAELQLRTRKRVTELPSEHDVSRPIKGEYARFLEEVNNKLDGIPEKVKAQVSELVNETYEQCWQGMIEGVSKSKDVSDLKKEFSAIRAVRPETVKAAVENPIPKLRLTPTLERNRKKTIANVKREIAVGLAQGDRMSTMAKRLYDKVNINYRQSILIARTEAHRVRETGLNDASQKVDEILKEHGSEYRKVKIWNTSGDSSVRDTHAKMHGVAVLVDEEFELPSGAKAKCPGTSGVASEDCNCRCFLTYDIVTDSEFYALSGRHFPDYDAKNSKSGLTKSAASDTINTGARITNPESPEAEEHAKRYYGLVRSMSNDAETIAANTGKKTEDIQKIKNYLFVDNSMYDTQTKKWRRFDEDCAIAQSWQRLIDGKDIKKHDITLIEHELYEMELRAQNPDMSYREAHAITQQIYNYKKESDEYYGNLDKHNKKR